MPANLNALIRYKTINSCLYGGKRKWSIQDLIEACSEALGESRGRYNRISERTLRDDLRVLKSDILGFNAPIEQEKGLYFYSDPQFSILTLKITDAGLADKILAFLIHLRNEIQHPELESILELLCKLTHKTYERPVSAAGIKIDQRDDIMFCISSLDETTSRPSKRVYFKLPLRKTVSDWIIKIKESLYTDEKTTQSRIFDTQSPKEVELSWGDVFAKTT